MTPIEMNKHYRCLFLLSLLCVACVSVCIHDNDNREYLTINDAIDCSIDTGSVRKALNHFWESTGFCPPDPHDNASVYMLSDDMRQNLALISALPHRAIKQIRIHFLLKLITVDSVANQSVAYNFTLLDNFLQLLWNNNLKPGFEIMGNPSNYFDNFENRNQLYDWKDLVRQIASRYSKRFGIDYVRSWNFESWNEPSIVFRAFRYDNISVTVDGYLNYYDACSQGLREAADGLTFGGPGDHWPRGNSSGAFVLDLLNHCVDGRNYFTGETGDTKLDFISLHEKGDNGRTDYIDSQEAKALDEIGNRFPSLKWTPFVENEGDPEVGWNRDRWWRADTSYAATVVQVIARRAYRYNFTNDLWLYGFDNGFLSLHPFHFTQRTLLARHAMNNSEPNYVRFVRKPVHSAMGLLAKLGNRLLNVKTSGGDNSTFNLIATAFSGNEELVYSVLFVNSVDAVRTNGSSRIKFRIDFNNKQIENNRNWKWSQYSLNNELTNPFQIWTQHDCPPFPSDQLFEDMKRQEEPFIHGEPQDLEPTNQTWCQTFDIGFPGVSLLLICGSSSRSPDKVENLRAINITVNSVLLIWNSSSIRCLKSYSVEYARNNAESEFSIINDYNIIYPSYQHTTNKSVSTNGYYRVRAVDFWNNNGPYSDVFRFT